MKLEEESGRPSFGDVTGEYQALHRSAGLVEGCHALAWARGPDAAAFLDGLLSQEVAGLSPGAVARSLLLSPQGKLRSLLWLLAGEDEVGLVADAGYAEKVVEDLARFRLRVDVELGTDREPVLEVWGPTASAVLESAGLDVPAGWARTDGAVVAACPLGGLPRFLVVGADPAGLVEAGARRTGSIAATAVRVEAGEPRMGVDVDDGTIPQEAGVVAAAVSFTKGCYLGQELVARIDSRGHVNRHLRGVVVASNVLPPEGATLELAGKQVGMLTSVSESLAVGAPIGLALVRREVEPGAMVTVRFPGGEVPAQVRELPLLSFG